MTANHQIFFHCQVSEDAPILGHIAKPQAHDLVSLLTTDGNTVENDIASDSRHQANDAGESGRLSRPIAAEKRHHFSTSHARVYIEKYMSPAIPRVEVMNFQFHSPTSTRDTAVEPSPVP